MISWNKPVFGLEEIEEVKKVIESNYVNEGPKTEEFEKLLRDYFGVKYIILTTSATAALFLSLKAVATLRNMEYFEAIVPDMTMIATATAINWAGGKPIIVDVNKEDLTIDCSKIEEKINSKTIAIVPVHVLGRSANMKRILDIARKFNLKVIEDAAGAMGSKLKDKFLGTIGDVGCFSLQSNKIITSGQGGIIALNDEELYKMIRRYRDFGRINNREFLHSLAGYNLKFNDLSAAFGVAQFRKLEDKKKLLLEQYKQYRNELESIKQIKFFNYKDVEIPIWVDVIVENRDELESFLLLSGIQTRKCWPSLHRNPPYKEQGTDKEFPNASFASDNVLWLPNGSAITSNDIKFICEKIKSFYMR